MAKSRREVQREIYDFIEDQEEPVILQTILDEFCKKYQISTTTVTRYLDELVNSRSPFRLRTWYDKNRYYAVPGLTIGARMASLLTLGIPLAMFFVDLFNPFYTRWYLFASSSFFFIGFWIAKWLDAIKKDGIQHPKKPKEI